MRARLCTPPAATLSSRPVSFVCAHLLPSHAYISDSASSHHTTHHHQALAGGVSDTLVAEPLQAPRKEYKPLTPADLVDHPVDPEQYKLPAGYHWYETMIVLRAMMDDQGRCVSWLGVWVCWRRWGIVFVLRLWLRGWRGSSSSRCGLVDS